ncbi:MAG TPA: DUF5362 family protein [Chitinophagaceae bacterium]|nr:DUF5362 family protein [Chitinophagaceae bacterium]
MEQNENTSLFGLTIDPNSKNHLSAAAGWAKFLAIVGFIACGLIILAGIFFGSIFAAYNNNRNEGFDRNPMASSGGMGAFAVVFYILVALLYFFPCLFLFNFASKMKSALLANDQELLNGSFQNLKRTFRFMGVLTIIGLSFYLLVLLVVVITMSAR